MIKQLQFLFLILISLNSFGEWKFHSSSVKGETFYLHTDTITRDEDYVYFWYLKNYLIPSKFGDLSSKVKVKGDCNNNRLKYLTYIWYKEPMGKGLGERSDTESEWENQTTNSVGTELLNDACNS